MTRTGIPHWTVDTLDVTGDVVTDSLGREWSGGTDGQDKGWIGLPKPRTARVAKPAGHGAYRSTAYSDVRVFTLGGVVACPSPAVREQTEVELAALCSDGGRLYEFRRRTDSYDHTAMVELDDEPLIEPVSFYTLKWSYQFAAPDPRKHDYRWQQPVCRPPGPTSSGVAYGPTGVNFGPVGVDYGSAPTGSLVAQVANFGTAPAAPVFQLVGPLSFPAVLHQESGRALRYEAELNPGEVLSINADDFPALGVPAHAAVSSARGNVGTLLVREGVDWPVVDPQQVGSFQLRASGDPAASLTVSFRSAWK